MHDEMPSSIKLTKASRRQWLVYATLNVLTGGARRKRPRCFKLVGTMSGVVSRSRCRCRCLETTSQCLSARLSHAARQSDCGVHNKRQQCHQAVQMNDDDTHAKLEWAAKAGSRSAIRELIRCCYTRRPRRACLQSCLQSALVIPVLYILYTHHQPHQLSHSCATATPKPSTRPRPLATIHQVQPSAFTPKCRRLHILLTAYRKPSRIERPDSE
jgi:hypothetical protein